MYNLEDPSLTLELSNVWEHFVGTYVTSLCQAHRSHKVISSFIDGVIFNPNRIAALPHEGSLSMVLEHSVGAARSAVIGRHEGVKMRLDLSNERDREVGISQLIKHLELRMDGGPKNASNAIGLKTSDGGQAMYVSDVKLDGRGVKVGGRGWFKNHKSGILEYKLNESYLRMNSEIRGKKECEIIIADVRGRRGVFLHSLTIDGTNVGVEELERRVEEGVGINGKSEWKTKVEIRCPDYVRNSNLLMAEDEEEEGKGKGNGKEKKGNKKKRDEEKAEAAKKEVEVVASIQLRHPSVVFTSVVTLNLLDAKEMAALKTYVGRARTCPGEGMLDVTLDGHDVGNIYEHTWCVPR